MTSSIDQYIDSARIRIKQTLLPKLILFQIKINTNFLYSSRVCKI